VPEDWVCPDCGALKSWGELSKTDRRIPMRNVALLAAVGILAGIGAWAASTTQARIEAAPNVRIDTLEIMMQYGKDLPTEEFVDNSFVFH